MTTAVKFLILAVVLSISSVSGQDPFKCISCNPADEKCTSDPTNAGTKECTTKNCYSSIGNDGKFTRGCVEGDIKCEGLSCKACTSDSCNTQTFSCKNCDSSSNPKCSQWMDDNAVANEICDDGISKCLMQIKEDKNIERRCLKGSDDKGICSSGKKCELCETASCNKGVFPKDRLQCYQCTTSTECANPATNVATVLSLPCVLYDESDKCFVYGTSDTAMARGCVSNTAAFSECQKTNEKCVQCDKSNCNNVTFKKPQTMKCIQCLSSDTNCAWGHPTSDAKDCKNPIEYWQTEKCYTKKIEASKVERGCFYDATDCTSPSCTTCTNGLACNNVDEMEFTCYKCRSDPYSACAKKLEGESYKPEKCRNVVTEADKGCYVERWNNLIIRSCLVDADEKTRKNCLDKDYKWCDSCTDKANCNLGDAPAGSAPMAAFGIGILALALLALKFV